MRTRLVRLTAIVGIAMLALTACGSDSDDTGDVASISGDTGDSDADSADTEQEALEWAQCMRDEGVDIPDPETDEDGNLRMGRVQVGPGGIDPEDFEAAREVCGEPPGREMSAGDQSEMQDAALEFAQCMRDKGYDWPDPEFNEDGGMMFKRGPGDGQIDMEDPEVQADMNECQEAFDGVGPEGGV
jgi:hypothetical protein